MKEREQFKIETGQNAYYGGGVFNKAYTRYLESRMDKVGEWVDNYADYAGCENPLDELKQILNNGGKDERDKKDQGE